MRSLNLDQLRAFVEVVERGGFTAAAKERLPKWITGRPTDDDQALVVSQDEMDSMLTDYYELRGWGTPAL